MPDVTSIRFLEDTASAVMVSPARRIFKSVYRQRDFLRKKRVGIYARVSTTRKAKLHSMSEQVSALTQYVLTRPDWMLADIYLDFDSASGVKMRSQFVRMLVDVIDWDAHFIGNGGKGMS